MTVHDPVLEKPRAQAAEADVQSIFQFRGLAPDVRRIALVGTYTPLKCGIATFGTDIVEKLGEFHPNISVDIYALEDHAAPIAYEGVAGTIQFDDPEAYLEAARRINESGVDAVWLQHEYGIFGC